MPTVDEILKHVVENIQELRDQPEKVIQPDDMLIGDDAALSSRELVEILLAMEEYSEETLGVEFDWSSDSAMSMRRSPYRTPRVLAEHLFALMENA